MKNVVARRRRHRSRHEISVRPDRTVCKLYFFDSVASIGDRVVDGDPVSRTGECQDKVIAVVRLRNRDIVRIDPNTQFENVEAAVSASKAIHRVPNDILTVSNLEHEGVVATLT